MTTLPLNAKRTLDNLVAEAAEAKKVPGFVFGVSNLEEEIYFKGGGWNIVDDPTSGEVNPDSVFWVCSQTKFVTALAALKLVDLGKVTFDTPVGDYLPEFQNPIIVDEASSQDTTFRPANTIVTLKHLLNFSSGLFYPIVRNDYRAFSEGYASKEMHQSPDPVSEFFRIITGKLPALPLKFEPGTDYVYGWSADALGFVIEKVSGQTLERFCQEHIFEPIGMKASFYLSPELKRHLVHLSFRQPDGGLCPMVDQVRIIEQDPSKVRLHLGGIGLYASMRDFLKLFRHLMQINAGHPVPNPILKTQTVHDIFVPTLTAKGKESLSELFTSEGTDWSVGLPVCTKDSPGRRRKGSAWCAGWAGTSGFMDPITGIAGVFGVQIAAPGDMEAQKLSSKLEAVLYAALNVPDKL